MLPDLPVWGWILAAIVAWLVALFVRWWWTHGVVERLDRIVGALERQSPAPGAPPAPTPQPEAPVVSWAGLAWTLAAIAGAVVVIWLAVR